ncbi:MULTISPECIES: hypothetical protein [Bacillus cereus group]|uniref:hypothetical protein n=1 Tax=Bacillus cereus group TaxID=86661 RepID=UPI001E5AD869|nr:MULTISPECIES: hypothetical protein [Bacillus cereus group]MEB9673230.1 hypothetical protein [Bacillus anthracis]
MIVNEEFKHQEQIDLLLAKQIKYGKKVKKTLSVLFIILLVAILTVILNIHNLYVDVLLILLATILFFITLYYRKQNVYYHITVMELITKKEIESIKESKYLTNGRKERYLTDFYNAKDTEKAVIFLRAMVEAKQNEELWKEETENI